jgi:dynein heavy chain 1
VFPGVDYVPNELASLLQHVKAICSEQRLVASDKWISKILQLYQIQKIQHGVMMVGPSGSGKSSAWKVLLAALERWEGTEGVSHVIDPKAMHKDALYGTLDSTTREWNDGLFTHILRRIIDNVRGESSKRHWIVFDGDVDPEWVENLNRFGFLRCIQFPSDAPSSVSWMTTSFLLCQMESDSIFRRMLGLCSKLNT